LLSRHPLKINKLAILIWLYLGLALR